MEESILYLAEGDPADKQSLESFAAVASLFNPQVHATFRNADAPRNGAVMTGVGPGERFFTASSGKALINVYSWGKESIEQRIPVPEALTTLAICHHPDNGDDGVKELPNYRVPWLLAGGTKSGKIYIWELASGDLLRVKDAHYQEISVVEFSPCGTFLITGGLDSRVLIWRTLDLVSIYGAEEDSGSIKPFASFTDHTLAISDLKLSSSGIINDLRLYTASRDGTLRVYDVMTKSLLHVFILPDAITCIARDPLDRALYAGLSNGIVRVIPLYKFNKNSSTLEAIGGLKKAITIEHDPNLETTFVHHQQQPERPTNGMADVFPTKIEVSFDGASIVSGDSIGRVFVADVYTKQVIKTLQPCNSSISQIFTFTTPEEVTSANSTVNDKNHRLIPQFKRVLLENDPSEHYLRMEIPKAIEPEQDFDTWLEKMKQEELEFRNLSSINSTVKVVDNGDSEKIEKLSKAYTELREKHQALYEEHKKLLNNS